MNEITYVLQLHGIISLRRVFIKILTHMSGKQSQMYQQTWGMTINILPFDQSCYICIFAQRMWSAPTLGNIWTFHSLPAFFRPQQEPRLRAQPRLTPAGELDSSRQRVFSGVAWEFTWREQRGGTVCADGLGDEIALFPVSPSFPALASSDGFFAVPDDVTVLWPAELGCPRCSHIFRWLSEHCDIRRPSASSGCRSPCSAQRDVAQWSGGSPVSASGGKCSLRGSATRTGLLRYHLKSNVCIAFIRETS